MALKQILFVLSLFVLTIDKTIDGAGRFGHCRSVTPVKTLDLAKFLGHWYVVGIEMGLGLARKCNQIIFEEDADPDYIRLHETSISKNDPKNVEATTLLAKSMEDGTFEFHIEFPSDNVTTVMPLYVLDIDYNEYAVLHTCANLTSTRIQKTFVLSRKPDELNMDIQAKVNTTLSSNGLGNIDILESRAQKLCGQVSCVQDPTTNTTKCTYPNPPPACLTNEKAASVSCVFDTTANKSVCNLKTLDALPSTCINKIGTVTENCTNTVQYDNTSHNITFKLSSVPNSNETSCVIYLNDQDKACEERSISCSIVSSNKNCTSPLKRKSTADPFLFNLETKNSAAGVECTLTIPQ